MTNLSYYQLAYCINFSLTNTYHTKINPLHVGKIKILKLVFKTCVYLTRTTSTSAMYTFNNSTLKAKKIQKLIFLMFNSTDTILISNKKEKKCNNCIPHSLSNSKKIITKRLYKKVVHPEFAMELSLKHL